MGYSILQALYTMRLHATPYHLFAAAAILLLLVSFFVSQQTLDMHLLDTYYVFDQPSLFRALSFALFLLWLLYVVNRRIIYSEKFTRAHVVATLLSLSLVLGSTLWTNKLRKDRTYLTQEGMAEYYRWEQVLGFFIIIMVAVQAVFLLNLVIGLVKALRQPEKGQP